MPGNSLEYLLDKTSQNRYIRLTQRELEVAQRVQKGVKILPTYVHACMVVGIPSIRARNMVTLALNRV